MARLTSEFFVSSLMRRTSQDGGFAVIVKKGALEAGAIYILVRDRTHGLRLFGPAPQQQYDTDRPFDRRFYHDNKIVTDEDVTHFLDKETRFDQDFWLVELETNESVPELPFEIMTP